MDNKQEELEAVVQLKNYSIVAITEAWWDNSHDWSAAMVAVDFSEGTGKKGDCLKLNDGI